LGFELAILDDGFQHRRLYRDLDIALYNTREKISLRENPSSFKRAHIILVKKSSEIQQEKILESIPSGSLLCEYSVVNKGFHRLNEEEILPSDAFQGKKALAFCGIARPERFLALLKNAGIEIVFSLMFPDHHVYPNSSLKKIISQYHKLKPDLAVTTEKDVIKIRSFNTILKDIPVYYVKIDLDIEGKFYEKVTLSLQNLAEA